LSTDALWRSPSHTWSAGDKIKRISGDQILRTAERELLLEGKKSCSPSSTGECVIAAFTKVVVWQTNTCLALDAAVPPALLLETQSLEQAALKP
jgi:hypothetical protein